MSIGIKNFKINWANGQRENNKVPYPLQCIDIGIGNRQFWEPWSLLGRYLIKCSYAVNKGGR